MDQPDDRKTSKNTKSEQWRHTLSHWQTKGWEVWTRGVDTCRTYLIQLRRHPSLQHWQRTLLQWWTAGVAFWTNVVEKQWQPWLHQFVTHPRWYWSRHRLAVITGVIVVMGMLFALIDLTPDLSHVDLTILSGPATGDTRKLVNRIAVEAAKQNGTVNHITTGGDIENLYRVIKATESGETLFAVVQAGLPYPEPDRLEFVARLPAPKTVFFLGPKADQIHYLSDLKNMRIGIGPPGSGTALFAQEQLGARDLAGLHLKLSTHPFAEQVDKLQQGELDLGVFVMAENSLLIKKAIRGGLQIASFANAEAWAARVPALRVTPLYAGHFDRLRLLPHTDKKVLQVDTLVLGPRRAARSDVIALLVLLDKTFPNFIAYNRMTQSDTGLHVAKNLRPFLKNEGPTILEEYAPRLVNFMPPVNIFHYVVVVSVLFNVTVLWHRFRLWRLDAGRVKLEERTFSLFGPHYTLDEIKHLQPSSGDFSPTMREQLGELIGQYEALRRLCRQYAVSILVPMGTENIYRYHEWLIDERLTALRSLQARVASLAPQQAPHGRF